MSTPLESVINATPKINPATRLGYVHLTVNNLDRQIQFYTQVLNFTLHWRKGAEAALGTQTEVLLRLTEDPAASRAQNTTGMYHFAVLYPSLKELARAIARLFALRYLNYPTDHGASKTTYLDDFEGNNIELYVRTLEDATWEIVNGQFVARYADGRVTGGRDPLDVEALFRELDESDRLDLPLPEGTRIGHVHLYASSLEDFDGFLRQPARFPGRVSIEDVADGRCGAGRPAAACGRLQHLEREGHSAGSGKRAWHALLHHRAAQPG